MAGVSGLASHQCGLHLGAGWIKLQGVVTGNQFLAGYLLSVVVHSFLMVPRPGVVKPLLGSSFLALVLVVYCFL